MAGRIILDACNPALDANGKVDDGATLQFYENRTTTPQPVYSTAAHADVNDGVTGTLTNPLSPDSAGRFPEIWGPDNYVYTVDWTPSGEAAITFNDIVTTAAPAAAILYYDLFRFIADTPGDGETVLIANMVRPLSLPVDLNDGTYPSIFTITTLPTSTMAFTLYKNSFSIGTISFSTGGVATVTFSSKVTFAAGDQFIINGPDTADATGALIALTFVFNVA